VTGLDWLQTIPLLRFHYDMIGGYARGLDESFDWLVPIAQTRSFFCPSSIFALQMCDFGILVSNDVPHGHWQVKSGFVLESLGEPVLRIMADVASSRFRFS
jgi:hypothetical protein